MSFTGEGGVVHSKVLRVTNFVPNNIVHCNPSPFIAICFWGSLPMRLLHKSRKENHDHGGMENTFGFQKKSYYLTINKKKVKFLIKQL
jgi:hypothetical protein